MKKIVFVFVTACITAVPLMALALTLPTPALPFGGLVATAPTTGATCPGGEPISPYTIVPFAGVPGLFVTTQWLNGVGFVRPGSWILGLYNPVPLPECVGVPPLNDAFRTTLYGTDTILPW